MFGDEFTGSSVESVMTTVDMLNREDKTGKRRVRIHALGFPVRPDAPQVTSIRFATLMRALCEQQRRHVRRPERAGQLCPLSALVRPCGR